MRHSTLCVAAGAALLGLMLVSGAVAQPFYPDYYNPRPPGTDPRPEYEAPQPRNPDLNRPAPTDQAPDLRVQGVRPLQGLPTPPSDRGRIGSVVKPIGPRD